MLNDTFHGGWVCIAGMPYSIHWVDELICSNCYITRDVLFSIVSISRGSVVALIEEFSYSKFCVYWLPQMLNLHTD